MKVPQTWFPGVLALSWALAAAGCVKETASPTKKDSEPSLAAHVVRGQERQQVQNDFHQLALYCKNYQAENGRTPDLKQLEAYMGLEGARLAKALKEGRYVLVPNPGPGPNAVLIYEKDKDLNGNRIVLQAPDAVTLMNEQEFQAALKGK